MLSHCIPADGDRYHWPDQQVHRSTRPHATHMQGFLAGQFEVVLTTYCTCSN